MFRLRASAQNAGAFGLPLNKEVILNPFLNNDEWPGRNRLGAGGTGWLTIDVECVLGIQTTLKPDGETSCCSATQPTGWATLVSRIGSPKRITQPGPSAYLRPSPTRHE